MHPYITTNMYQFLDLTDVQVGDTIFFCPNFHEQHKFGSGAIGPTKCSVCKANYYFVRVQKTADIEYLQSKQ